ncbi:hypothetical protein [Desulfosporosinus sp. OT]|uniref:hypothetical protein n=1 Tax=Desulfosporosinus sp. OT TaxID=913865 RepID=UPI000223A8FE|nr:hypothetical protein [Desulfosporosinus sp. OT]EGW39056.1 hypothetical protein DOT_3007 [Desulfosporosinus sp. OT]
MANQAATFTVIIKDKATGKPVTGAEVMMSPATMSNRGNMDSSDNSNSMVGMDMSSSIDKQGASAMLEQSSMGSMAMDPGTYMMEGMFNQPGQWNYRLKRAREIECANRLQIIMSNNLNKIAVLGDYMYIS